MDSRIPSSVCARPSASNAAAEQIWPGGAVAALEGVVLDEGVLHRMQGAVRRRQALDRRDVRAVPHDGQLQACVDALAIDQHGAGAALAVVAALLAARQVKVLQQQIQQAGPGSDGAGVFDAVDGQANRQALDGGIKGRVVVGYGDLAGAVCCVVDAACRAGSASAGRQARRMRRYGSCCAAARMRSNSPLARSPASQSLTNAVSSGSRGSR